MSRFDILVLEDEALIAMDIEMTLQAAGHDNIAVCHSSDDALARLTQSNPKVAVLDFNLGNGTNSVPVAEQLSRDGVPFIFLSGYTVTTVQLPEGLKAAPRLAKPFRSEDLLAEVQSALDG